MEAKLGLSTSARETLSPPSTSTVSLSTTNLDQFRTIIPTIIWIILHNHPQMSTFLFRCGGGGGPMAIKWNYYRLYTVDIKSELGKGMHDCVHKWQLTPRHNAKTKWRRAHFCSNPDHQNCCNITPEQLSKGEHDIALIGYNTGTKQREYDSTHNSKTKNCLNIPGKTRQSWMHLWSQPKSWNYCKGKKPTTVFHGNTNTATTNLCLWSHACIYNELPPEIYQLRLEESLAVYYIN